MTQPTPRQEQLVYCQKLCEAMFDCIGQPSTCDLMIATNGGVVLAHSVVLMNLSAELHSQISTISTKGKHKPHEQISSRP